MVCGLTNKQALSELRSKAKKMGLVLREQNLTINGNKAYKVVHRKSDEVIMSNMTLTSCMYNFEFGEIEERLIYFKKHLNKT